MKRANQNEQIQLYYEIQREKNFFRDYQDLYQKTDEKQPNDVVMFYENLNKNYKDILEEDISDDINKKINELYEPLSPEPVPQKNEPKTPEHEYHLPDVPQFSERSDKMDDSLEEPNFEVNMH